MNMQIGKWGNSLAVRLPREIVDRFDLKEGNTVGCDGLIADLTKAQVEVAAERRERAFEVIAARRWKLPDDWKFDRNEEYDR